MGRCPTATWAANMPSAEDRVFVDEGWKRDADFLKNCAAAYQKCRHQLDPVLAALGYGDTKAMQQELSKCLSALDGRPRSRRLTALTRIGGWFGLRKAA